VTSEVIFFEKYLRKKSFIPIQATIRNNIYEDFNYLVGNWKKVIEHGARVLPTID
jgi:hypothetical protein